MLPTPFYQDSHVTLYCGDCREIAPLLPRARVGIADPPYGETALAWDKWPDGWPTAIKDCSDQLWCFGSMRMFLHRFAEFKEWTLAQDVIWKKTNGSNARTDRFRRVHEYMLHFYRGKWGSMELKSLRHFPPWKKGFTRVHKAGRFAHFAHAKGYKDTVTVYDASRQVTTILEAGEQNKGKTNSTKKPESLVRTLLEYSASRGGLVHDYFSGSGTVVAVAKKMGLHAIGIEGREEQCADIVARVSQILPGCDPLPIPFPAPVPEAQPAAA